MKKKQITQLILALLVGLMFISSYFTLANLNGSQAQTHAQSKAQAVPSTVYGFGTANAAITGYNGPVQILVGCNSSESAPISTTLSSLLSELESNNSISNSYSIQNQTEIQTGSAGAAQLYSIMASRFNSSAMSCVRFSSQALAALPSTVPLYIVNKTYQISIPQNLSTVQIPVVFSGNTPKQVPVKISALIELNGTIYSLNVTETQGPG